MMRRRTSPRGLTLLELLLAVAITSCIGLAMAAVMTSVARGMTSSGDARSALQRIHAGYVRLRAYSEPSRCLLQHDPARGFVLWLHDEFQPGTINLREIRAFWFDTAAGRMTVERVVFPEAWPEEMKEQFDAPLTPGADFLFEMLAMRTLGYTGTEVITDGMRSFTLSHGAPSVESAARFTLVFSADAGDGRTEEILAAFALPSHSPPQ